MRRITGATRLAGVIGQPVAHSLSPLIHNAWLEAAGIDAVYVALPATPDRFGALIEAGRDGVFLGLNITLPFKEIALRLADRVDAAAEAAGAANLLLFTPDNAAVARNTDGLGLLSALAAQAPGLSLPRARVCVLGAGGAARGAVAALLAAHAGEVRIVNRSAERAQALAALFGARARAIGWGAWGEALADVDLIVNATSLGLDGAPELDLPLELAPGDAVVMDMVYRPLRTGLLQGAAARGLATVDGLAMLIGQAGPSFQAMLGCAPPGPEVIDVRALCLEALEAAA